MGSFFLLTMSSRIPLSAVLITRNCATSLAPTLAALAFCDEIIIADSGSDDGTQDLARSFGARVVLREWMGFGRHKRFAVSEARNDWVLCIDSDELVSEELRSAIERELAAPAHTAYEFPRCNRFLGRYLRHGEGYPDWSLRLFDRRHANWSEDAVHEKVLTSGSVGRLKGDLLHHSEETLERYMEKQNHYTSLAAQRLFQQGKFASPGKLVFSPLLRFVKFYLLRRGFLDGIPGLIHIAIGCFNSFLKYAKVREAKSKLGRPSAH